LADPRIPDSSGVFLGTCSYHTLERRPLAVHLATKRSSKQYSAPDRISELVVHEYTICGQGQSVGCGGNAMAEARPASYDRAPMTIPMTTRNRYIPRQCPSMMACITAAVRPRYDAATSLIYPIGLLPFALGFGILPLGGSKLDLRRFAPAAG
jgi:hypothetical protein